MIDDPIVEEIHRYRAAHAKRFNYDIAAMARDALARQKASGAVVIPAPKKPKKLPRRAAKRSA